MDVTKTVVGLATGGSLAAAGAYFANRFGAHVTNDDVAHLAPIIAGAAALFAHSPRLQALWAKVNGKPADPPVEPAA